jgi:hypothetical protein
MDVLAFGCASGARDRVDVRGHSVHYQIRALGRGHWLHNFSHWVQGQNGLKSASLVRGTNSARGSPR